MKAESVPSSIACKTRLIVFSVWIAASCGKAVVRRCGALYINKRQGLVVTRKM
jgi:hypothetical protein